MKQNKKDLAVRTVATVLTVATAFTFQGTAAARSFAAGRDEDASKQSGDETKNKTDVLIAPLLESSTQTETDRNYTLLEVPEKVTLLEESDSDPSESAEIAVLTKEENSGGESAEETAEESSTVLDEETNEETNEESSEVEVSSTGETSEEILEDAGNYGMDEEDIDLLAALVYYEANTEPAEGQVAVASVVLNRIVSSEYPDNLEDVIYEKSQFQPACFCAEMAEAKSAPESCYDAVYEALAGEQPVGDCLHFMRKELHSGIVIQNHCFW